MRKSVAGREGVEGAHLSGLMSIVMVARGASMRWSGGSSVFAKVYAMQMGLSFIEREKEGTNVYIVAGLAYNLLPDELGFPVRVVG